MLSTFRKSVGCLLKMFDKPTKFGADYEQRNEYNSRLMWGERQRAVALKLQFLSYRIMLNCIGVFVQMFSYN